MADICSATKTELRPDVRFNTFSCQLVFGTTLDNKGVFNFQEAYSSQRIPVQGFFIPETTT